MRGTASTLLKLIEECSEVIQAACKVLDFGPDSRWPDSNAPSNIEHLTSEIGDLLAVIDVLRDETDLNISNKDLIVAKEKKIKKMEIYLPHLHT
jgi:NTP pyrophosphatase (non-canonical NTP hydrolase)